MESENIHLDPGNGVNKTQVSNHQDLTKQTESKGENEVSFLADSKGVGRALEITGLKKRGRPDGWWQKDQ